MMVLHGLLTPTFASSVMLAVSAKEDIGIQKGRHLGALSLVHMTGHSLRGRPKWRKGHLTKSYPV